MASTRPAVLKCVVEQKDGPVTRISGIKYFHQYQYCVRELTQRGYQLLSSLYVDINRCSPEYAHTCSRAEASRIQSLLDLPQNKPSTSINPLFKQCLEEEKREQIEEFKKEQWEKQRAKLKPKVKRAKKTGRVDWLMTKQQKEREKDSKRLGVKLRSGLEVGRGINLSSNLPQNEDSSGAYIAGWAGEAFKQEAQKEEEERELQKELQNTSNMKDREEKGMFKEEEALLEEMLKELEEDRLNNGKEGGVEEVEEG